MKTKHQQEVKKAKEELIELINKYLSADKKEKILNFIDETTFSTDPASIKYHNALHGGLLLHSLNIIKIALKLNTALEFNISEESILISAIFHDYCKVGTYKIGTKKIQNPLHANDKTKGYGWTTVPKYEYQKATEISYGHGFKSLMLTFNKFGFEFLNDNEKEAIAYHMGLFDEQVSADCMQVYKKNKLAYIIHVADLTAGLYFESDGEVPELIF